MDVIDTVPGQTERRLTAEVEPLTLGDYVELVWRFRVFVVGAVIVAAVAAFTASMVGPRVYESTVTFAATQSKLGDAGQPVANTAAFRPMVESLTTAAAVIRDVGLDKPPHNMRPSEFLARVISVSEVRGTPLITVKVIMEDPELAAKVANSVADHAVQTARRVSASEATYARDLIKEQLDLARGRLDAADAQLRDYRQQVRIETVRKDAEARLGGPRSPAFAPRSQPGVPHVPVFVDESAGGRPGVMDLLVTIASERARLAAMEADLARRSRVDAQTKTIDPVYQDLDARVAAARSNLASLERQRAQQTASYKPDATTLGVLDHLYAVETELARRQVERDVAERIYVDLSQRFQDARLQVISRSAEFVIIDPAVPADRPVSRHVARNTAIGVVVGLCFALAGVLLWHAAARRRHAPLR